MNWNDWYTDTVDVFRSVPVKTGSLTRMERRQVLSDIPCRIYRKGSKAPDMTQTASSIQQTSFLACGTEAEFHTGDELLIHRGARLGHRLPDVRAFAGEPNFYFEPFGAVMPGLAHQELALLQQEYAS